MLYDTLNRFCGYFNGIGFFLLCQFQNGGSVALRATDYELHRDGHEEHQDRKDDKRDVIIAEKVIAKVGKRRAERKARGAGGGKKPQNFDETLVSEQLAGKEGEHDGFQRQGDGGEQDSNERDGSAKGRVRNHDQATERQEGTKKTDVHGDFNAEPIIDKSGQDLTSHQTKTAYRDQGCHVRLVKSDVIHVRRRNAAEPLERHAGQRHTEKRQVKIRFFCGILVVHADPTRSARPTFLFYGNRGFLYPLGAFSEEEENEQKHDRQDERDQLVGIAIAKRVAFLKYDGRQDLRGNRAAKSVGGKDRTGDRTLVFLAPRVDDGAHHSRSCPRKTDSEQNARNIENVKAVGVRVQKREADQTDKAAAQQLFRTEFADQKAEKYIENRCGDVAEGIVERKQASFDSERIGDGGEVHRSSAGA